METLVVCNCACNMCLSLYINPFNCMNEDIFNKLFPKVKLSICLHEIWNFGNSVADISIPGQFHTYLQLRGERKEIKTVVLQNKSVFHKGVNTFIVTDANGFPNLVSHGATFRMDVLLPNYLKSMVIEREIVPHFQKMSGDKMRAPTGPSNVFQILNQL